MLFPIRKGGLSFFWLPANIYRLEGGGGAAGDINITERSDEKMGDNVLTLVTAIDTKGMEKGFEAIKKGTVSTAKAVTKTLNTISDTIKKLASIYVLKNVFDKLKNYLDTTIRKNREFAASMKNLRGSLAAAFQPIYETIAPGLIYLVNVLN